jgi:hypothetical protein
MYRIIATLCGALLAVPAHAESLLQQVRPDLDLRSERMADAR